MDAVSRDRVKAGTGVTPTTQGGSGGSLQPPSLCSRALHRTPEPEGDSQILQISRCSSRF